MTGDKTKYETVRDGLNTRENSTLVIATVASSASLVLLTAFDTQGFRCYAFLFALLGILYREITIFSSDRCDNAFLKKPEYSDYHPKPEVKVVDRIARFIRSSIFRGLLAIPIIIFRFEFITAVIIIIVLLVSIEECMIHFEWIKQKIDC